MCARILVIGLILFCMAAPLSAQDKGEGVTFFEISHDFGTLKKGKTYKYDFEYTNNGESPVVILDVKAGCTCTKVKWSKKPLKKEEKEELTVSYAARDTGAFRKDITIKTSAPSTDIVLVINGVVEK